MPKKRVIDKYVLQVLEGAPALRFSEVKERLSTLLHREVKNRVVAENLGVLISQNLVEKILDNKDGHVKYRLTQYFFTKQAIVSLQGILAGVEEQQLLSRLEDAEPPLLVFTQKFDLPPHLPEGLYDKEVADFCTYLDFNNQAEVIAKRMMTKFRAYPGQKQEEAEKMLFWAYWAGVQSKITLKEPFCWLEVVNDAEDFAKKRREEAEREWNESKQEEALRRMKAEDALLKIIGIVKELIQKPNLDEFLGYLFEKKREVEKLKSEIVEATHNPSIGGGEDLFDEFLNFHELILRGLSEANLLPLGRKIGDERYGLRYLDAYGDVWNAFFHLLLADYWVIRRSQRPLSDIKGEAAEAVAVVKYYKSGLSTLRELPYHSRTLIVYLWGYPEVMMLSDKSILPDFEEWLQALEAGYLDHRSHLFTEDVERRLSRAIRNVKQGKPPPREMIDFVMWTLDDLYRSHPRGKDPDFYREILEAIKERRDKRS